MKGIVLIALAVLLFIVPVTYAQSQRNNIGFDIIVEYLNETIEVPFRAKILGCYSSQIYFPSPATPLNKMLLFYDVEKECYWQPNLAERVGWEGDKCNFTIGVAIKNDCSHWADSYFDGILDEIGIFNYQKTEFDLSAKGSAMDSGLYGLQPDEGTIAIYDCEDQSNQSGLHGINSSGDAYDMTFKGMGEPSYTTDSRVGDFAIHFDGKDDLVYHPSFFDDMPKDGTIEFWFKPDAEWNATDGRERHIINKINSWEGGTNYFTVWKRPFYGEMHFHMVKNGISHNISSVTDVWKRDQWYHVAATWGSNGMHLYVNGVEEGSNSVTDVMADPGRTCENSMCHFRYIPPSEFLVVIYIPTSGELYISDAIARDFSNNTYVVEIKPDQPVLSEMPDSSSYTDYTNNTGLDYNGVVMILIIVAVIFSCLIFFWSALFL
jgi:hypothetical protein